MRVGGDGVSAFTSSMPSDRQCMAEIETSHVPLALLQKDPLLRQGFRAGTTHSVWMFSGKKTGCSPFSFSRKGYRVF